MNHADIYRRVIILFSINLEKALTSRFCRTPHYLTGQYRYADNFSFDDDILIWDASTDKRMFMISVQFDPQTYQILSFDCICAMEKGKTSSGIPIPKACHISPDEKRYFLDQFSRHVTKRAEFALESWKYSILL